MLGVVQDQERRACSVRRGSRSWIVQRDLGGLFCWKQAFEKKNAGGVDITLASVQTGACEEGGYMSTHGDRRSVTGTMNDVPSSNVAEMVLQGSERSENGRQDRGLWFGD